MRKAGLVLLVLLFLLIAFPRSASVAVPGQHFQNPPDFPHDVTAGRPGTFRFITNEQLRADRIEIADLRIGIERIQRLLPILRDPAAQRDIATELDRWSLHTARLEQRMNSSVSPTAATVETRLTQSKGQRNCGVCHGGMPDAPMKTVY
jgi:hypothetical protein